MEEVEAPVAGSGQVVVEVRAAGLNFPDVLMTEGKYQVRDAKGYLPSMNTSPT